MTLTPAQMAQAVAAARAIVAAHSTGFINYNNMVSDAQIAAALTEVLAAVTEETK
jgi:hypothetical protein